MRVRLLLIFLIASVVCPSMLMAQREYSPKFYLGGKGGATLSKMTFSPGVHQKMVQGVTFGLTARYTEEKMNTHANSPISRFRL